MPEFLTLMPPGQALRKLLDTLPAPVILADTIPALEASGRVTAAGVQAPHPLPAFNRSSVDGYAVIAADTNGSSESLPAYLTLTEEIRMGTSPTFRLERGKAAPISTGGMLPEAANAVVMLEYTQHSRPGELEVLRPAAPGENVIAAGEDVEAGTEVIAAGRLIRPEEIGGLAALGITSLAAARKPRVGILSSGDEIVPVSAAPAPGQVRDVNTYTLSALAAASGAVPQPLGIIPDDAEYLHRAAAEGLAANDILVITAGSSASARDLTAEVVNSLGKPGVVVHGVNVRPGKPTILAVCDGKPVIGLPGNPVSALVIARLFLVPLIDRLLGLPEKPTQKCIHARLAVNMASQAGREDWIPATIVQTPQGLAANPIFFKSNLIFNLANADGLIYIPADATGLSAGDLVEVY
jgi:molybdopterin molybdotransferase